jgi:hexokinase
MRIPSNQTKSNNFRMKKGEFKLKTAQLKDIALDLEEKIEIGLKNDDTEIKGIPTFIHPLSCGADGQAVVIDWGGTNYRAAVINFNCGVAKIAGKKAIGKDISAATTKGFTQEDLLAKQSEFVNEIELPAKVPVGYCFSYPAECLPNGDAKLIKWTKGIDIKEMVGKPVGKPLLDQLNKSGKTKFTSIKVINDTVASLFAGLTNREFDAYIGLIVGTGTNMAAFINADRIPKIDSSLNWQGLTPVNLESGNYNPPHLNKYDELLDEKSGNKGTQRFEKAVSGMYIGQLLREAFPEDGFDETLDGKGLTDIINNYKQYKIIHVKVAKQIYKRSAKLVAASLAGLINMLIAHDSSIKKVRITAEGSLFWSEVVGCKDYSKVVKETLKELLSEMGHSRIKLDITEIESANMIGSGIAALS